MFYLLILTTRQWRRTFLKIDGTLPWETGRKNDWKNSKGVKWLFASWKTRGGRNFSSSLAILVHWIIMLFSFAIDFVWIVLKFPCLYNFLLQNEEEPTLTYVSRLCPCSLTATYTCACGDAWYCGQACQVSRF